MLIQRHMSIGSLITAFLTKPNGKTKIDHLLDMLHAAYFKKQLPFRTVLMDSWYVSMKVMKAIEALSKVYYAPLKRNRLVNDTDGVEPHQQVQNLSWSLPETTLNACISKGFRKDIK